MILPSNWFQPSLTSKQRQILSMIFKHASQCNDWQSLDRAQKIIFEHTSFVVTFVICSLLLLCSAKYCFSWSWTYFTNSVRMISFSAQVGVYLLPLFHFLPFCRNFQAAPFWTLDLLCQLCQNKSFLALYLKLVVAPCLGRLPASSKVHILAVAFTCILSSLFFYLHQDSLIYWAQWSMI